MKKSYQNIAIGILSAALGIVGFTLNDMKKGHYFGTGIATGVGLSLITSGILDLKNEEEREGEDKGA